jgi:hypothetical protein
MAEVAAVLILSAVLALDGLIMASLVTGLCKDALAAWKKRPLTKKWLGARQARRLFEELLSMRLDAMSARSAMLREAEIHKNVARSAGNVDRSNGRSH